MTQGVTRENARSNVAAIAKPHSSRERIRGSQLDDYF